MPATFDLKDRRAGVTGAGPRACRACTWRASGRPTRRDAGSTPA